MRNVCTWHAWFHSLMTLRLFILVEIWDDHLIRHIDVHIDKIFHCIYISISRELKENEKYMHVPHYFCWIVRFVTSSVFILSEIRHHYLIHSVDIHIPTKSCCIWIAISKMLKVCSMCHMRLCACKICNFKAIYFGWNLIWPFDSPHKCTYSN